jgi:hypothetical protein
MGNKYAKRNCHKARLHYRVSEEIKDGYRGIFYIGKRHYAFYMQQEHFEYLKRCLPQEKIIIWFIATSKKKNGFWNTYLILRYLESKRINAIDYATDHKIIQTFKREEY